MDNLLSDISQIIKIFVEGLNKLFNADLHGLEILGLFLGINIVITGFKKLIHHGWQKRSKTTKTQAAQKITNI